MRVRRSRCLAAGAVVIALVAGGTAAATPEASENRSAAVVPGSIVAALDSASRAEQLRIFRALTPEQQTAVLQPGSIRLVTPGTNSKSAADDTEQVVPLTGAGVGATLPTELINSRANCGNQPWSVGPYFEVKAVAGNTLYEWHFDIAWHGNCKTITSLDYHYAYPTNIFALETYKGKLTDTIEGKGSPSGAAIGQGRMAACFHIGPVNQCIFETDPIIHINFNSDGSGNWWGAT